MEQVDKVRRLLLKRGLSASTVALVMAGGLTFPTRLLAHWPQEAFSARSVEDALLAIMGEAEMTKDVKVRFTKNKPAKKQSSGDSVTVEVDTDLEQIDRLAILVDSNPFPLAMSMEMTPAVQLPIKTRIKIAGNGHVIAVVRSGDKLYQVKKAVRVSVGGDI